MKIKLIKWLILCCLAFPAFAQKSTNYQKIDLDEHYSHLKKKDAKDKTTYNYKVTKADGIILDCSKFDFSGIIKLNKNTNPDLIFIVAKSGTFSIPLNMKGETIIDKTTMIPIGHKNKFDGFKKGDTPIIGIGTISVEGETAALKTFWVSLMDIE